ncbi:MAG: hypothetical protein ACRC23_01865 [Aeromonas jandaei]
MFDCNGRTYTLRHMAVSLITTPGRNKGDVVAIVKSGKRGIIGYINKDYEYLETSKKRKEHTFAPIKKERSHEKRTKR